MSSMWMGENMGTWSMRSMRYVKSRSNGEHVKKEFENEGPENKVRKFIQIPLDETSQQSQHIFPCHLS